MGRMDAITRILSGRGVIRVIQIDMDMPTDCFCCPMLQSHTTFCNGLNYYCGISKKDIHNLFKRPKSCPPIEVKDTLEKAVAVEVISDELMSRFDISATYAYEVAETAVNRIEVVAKKMDRGEDG